MDAKSPREHLADALEAEGLAEEQLADARAASKRAWEMILQYDREIGDLQREIKEADTGDVVAALASGDLAELTTSVTGLRRKIDEKQQMIDTLRDAQRQAEEAIEARQTALDWATRKTARAAADVVSAETNVDQLLADCAQAQATVIAKRAELMALGRAMGDGDEQRRVADFLAQGWALPLMGDGWTHQATAIRVTRWAEALRRESAAESPPHD